MNILLADDIQGWLDFNQQNIKHFLDKKDMNFYSFLSAKEAYDFAFSFDGKIDIVVSDLEMEQNYDEPAGAWLIRNLKTTKSTSGAKFIIISASPMIKYIAEDVGADAYYRKGSYRLNTESFGQYIKEICGA